MTHRYSSLIARILLICMCPLFSNFAFSAIQPSQSPEPQPIDDLQQSLEKNFHSKEARLLKQAYDALVKNKYSEALRLATQVLKNETFSDYSYWIAASANRAL